MTACPPTIKSLSLVLTIGCKSFREKRVDRATPTLPFGFGGFSVLIMHESATVRHGIGVGVGFPFAG
jgi:hypothetical protein